LIRTAVIGAGLSGLVLARALRDHAEVSVFEKSRGFGGRMATRRRNDFQFDHGAQYFSAKTESFRRYLEPWLDAGVVAHWDARFVEFEGNRIDSRRTWSGRPAHYVGVPGMSALGGALAQSLDVKTESRVDRIAGQAGAWRLHGDEAADLGEFDWVVSSIPAAQAATLLPQTFAHLDLVAQRNMSGCYALMLGFDEPLPIDWDAALIRQADISWISQDGSKPGRGGNTLLVQATNHWSEAHMDLNERAVTEHMLAEIERITGLAGDHARYSALHRWRYANTAKQEGPRALVDPVQQLVACGDWCIHGRVEAAYLSGLDAAEQIKSLL